MNKQEEILDFVVETFQQKVGIDHTVGIVEDTKVHICGQKYHFTVDLLDIIDDAYEEECDNVLDNINTAFKLQFPDHNIEIGEDGSLTVSGKTFNFSIHLADVKTQEKLPSDDFDFGNVGEID